MNELASNPSLLTALEWLGCILGLTGAFLLATNSAVSRYGWFAYLAANFATIALAIGIDRHGLLIQQVGFLATTCLGIYRARRTHPRVEVVRETLRT